MYDIKRKSEPYLRMYRLLPVNEIEESILQMHEMEVAVERRSVVSKIWQDCD